MRYCDRNDGCRATPLLAEALCDTSPTMTTFRLDEQADQDPNVCVGKGNEAGKKEGKEME